MYSKYKDADPKDTIDRIKGIFNEVGIDLVCKTEKHIDGIYSSYLTDSMGHWQTEGKGTTVQYCEASSYGEAMEHLCIHHAFDISTVSDSARQYKGFKRYPDEQVFPVEKITELPVIMDELREPYHRLGKNPPSDEEIVELWKRILKSDVTSFVPYYCVAQEKCVFLPDEILSKLCGSNGSGCGNTPEEAVGHALDEVIERWCKYKIFSEDMTPPEIPDSYLKKRCPDLLKLKQTVETQGGLKILVRDASLGRGYPVVMIALIDQTSMRYLVNFGCHPQFEIALERCFTEIFQDRRVVSELIERNDMIPWSRFKMDSIHCQLNWTKLLSDDIGIWPEELFSTRASWDFIEWQQFNEYSNSIGMKAQLNRLRADGAEIFIRNVGFFGFPVYKVFIKNISTSHINFTEDILNDLDVHNRIRQFLSKGLSEDDMCSVGRQVFGNDSIVGRLFFYSLSNEEFALLYAAFLMEYENTESVYKLLFPWNGRKARMVIRILELAERMGLTKAIECSRNFASDDVLCFLNVFFSEHPFENTLSYFHISSESRQSMSGEKLRSYRDALMIRIKDYMYDHIPEQGKIRLILAE